MSNQDVTGVKAVVDDSEISQDIQVLLKSLPQDKRQEVLNLILATQKSHSGPLPDGETLRIYDTIIPNGGDRLMKQVENQQAHRFNLENEGLKRTFNQSATGQWIAFAIATIFGLLSWDLIKNGYEISGTILGTVDIASLVTVFLTSRSK